MMNAKIVQFIILFPFIIFVKIRNIIE